MKRLTELIDISHESKVEAARAALKRIRLNRSRWCCACHLTVEADDPGYVIAMQNIPHPHPGKGDEFFCT
ncbi:hypothetical protein [uncultured Herbaspirillum sp.]|uniref:hypothetical protein n=1 Tax=uncultured Herbaspirillum sp. TaxID=160236 RepID=UPI0019005104|nr:hypothetical protein [uncultured Herbaspirillum sp.]MCP1575867.1 hypothetical protein [Herbaspirillum rubrisubalbicans]